MTPFRVIEVLIALATVLSLGIGAFLYLEERHASRMAMLETELEVREEILDRDIKKDAEARVYYKDKAKLAPLDTADQSRLEYLEEQLDRKYQEQDRIQARLMQIEGQ